MSKLKVMTILGTRPEIIRLSSVIRLFDRVFNHVLVHTGQNWDYNLNEIFFKELQIRKPEYFLESAGEHLGQTIGNIISKSYELLRNEEPDALLVLGDTNSALCTIPAKRLKIPIFHMEAGNRCFDQNVPEEINRKIVDHISDINLPYTEHSRKYLLSEGFRKEHIFVTGSPMREVIRDNLQQVEQSNVLNKLKLDEKKYFVVSIHREENIDIGNNFNEISDTLNKVAEKYEMPIVFSTHPRTRKKIKEKGVIFNSLIKNIDPLGFIDYVQLQKKSYCVISDSGTLSEESSILDFPAVLIRTSTERPEAVESGNIVIGGLSSSFVEQAINMVVKKYSAKIPNDYKDECVSVKVANIIQSYTHIINRIVWYK